jgi:3',5'-cyclic AMP phosphodiesterase CpdA
VIQSAASTSEELRLIVFGDSGSGSPEQKRLAALIDSEEFDAVLHTGDLAYDSGKPEELFKNYTSVYSDRIRNSIWPSLGNHDYLTDAAKPYLDLFDLPKLALSSQESERYYSIDLSNTHIIALDTNLPLDRASDGIDDDMLDWLVEDLTNIPSNKPIIVFFHHPPFNAGRHGDDERVKSKLVPIFDKYGVDLVLSGHDHNYQRTCPIKFTTNGMSCLDDGLTYIITGGGGRSLYDLNKPAYVEVAKSEYHYLRISVSKRGLISIEAVNIDGQIIDEYQYFINRY